MLISVGAIYQNQNNYTMCHGNEPFAFDKNHVLLMSSYRTGCYPGRLQANSFENAYRDLKDEFGDILKGYVSLLGDDCEQWSNIYLQSESHLAVIRDSNEHLLQSLFGTHPNYIILDQEGKLRYRSQTLNYEELRQSIRESISELSPSASPPLPPVETLSPPSPQTYNSLLVHRMTTIGIDRKICDAPVDVAIDSDKNLFVACKNSECIYTVDKDGNAQCLRDRAFYHYNAHLTAIDISGNMLVTCQNSQNDYGGTKTPNMFMGLTLYNLSIPFIRTTGDDYNSSDPLQVPYMVHVDMLHEAPNCTGMVTLNKKNEDQHFTNRYLQVDNLNAQLVVTDFKTPHGPGSMDHSTAQVERLFGIPLSENIGGVAADSEREVAYVADTGFDRVLEVYYTSGSVSESARYDFPIYSSIEESFVYGIRENLSWNNMLSISRPHSVALHGRFLYVANYQAIEVVDTGTYTSIHRYSMPSTGAIRIFDSHMYVVDHQSIKIYKTGEIERREHSRKKTINEYCEDNDACLSATCDLNAQKCQPQTLASYTIGTTNNLQSYINSESYNRSFVAQHILTGGFGSYANYLNLYPVMQPDFCQTVGNASGVPDCDLIDFDSLLLGACWGHPCLPNHLQCLNGGTVVYESYRGYHCKCSKTHTGDACQEIKPPSFQSFSRSYLKYSFQRAGCCEDENCRVMLPCDQ